MNYELPKLDYAYDALEPHIDARTMEIHHTRHHATYVDNLNKILSQCPSAVQSRSLEELLCDIHAIPEDLRQGFRNHGGGHHNHSLFWQCMGPSREHNSSSELGEAIKSNFGTCDAFREKFTQAAIGRFGSGWSWLCLDKKGQLEVMSTPNQDSPLMLGLTPVMGLDVWEHAYYLNYQNRRADYIEAWWECVDWSRVNERYLELCKATSNVSR